MTCKLENEYLVNSFADTVQHFNVVLLSYNQYAFFPDVAS